MAYCSVDDLKTFGYTITDADIANLDRNAATAQLQPVVFWTDAQALFLFEQTKGLNLCNELQFHD